ncbi:MAG: hypothetical protein KUG68_12155 [Flavobacteriaceae bacterium]|nr:hypothetical protein [Flavobacteriaceae bacterium]
MAELFRFWSHGVSLVPQFTQVFTNTNNGLRMECADWGTKVSQNAGTDNWFHFPLTSATSLDGDGAVINSAFFLADINNDATISGIHLTMIDQSPATKDPILLINQNLNITGQNDRFDFNFRQRIVGGALVLSIKVRFDRDNGSVIFKSAGANTFEI